VELPQVLRLVAGRRLPAAPAAHRQGRS